MTTTGMVISRVICLLIGYLLGAFQTGYFYGKAHHVDIREHGSGGTGSTNTMRTLGKKAGTITFVGDLCKAMLAILVAWLLFHRTLSPGYVKVMEMYAGLGAVLGHNYPFYMKFKGGKGIACTSGFILACYWQIAPICLLLFIVAVAATRYVSLGSIAVVISFFIQLVVFVQTGIIQIPMELRLEVYLLGAAFTLLALWKHRENIVRLLHGQENKISFGKKEGE